MQIHRNSLLSGLWALVVVSLVSLGGQRAGAEVLVSEGFEDYGLGTAVGQNGGGGRWNETWRHMGLPTQQSVVESGLQYDAGGVKIDGGERALEVTGGKPGGVLVRGFDKVTGPEVYLRFLIQLADDTLDAEDFAAVYFNEGVEGPQTGYTDLGVLFARLFLSKTPNAYVSSGSIEPGRTHLLVMKLERVSERYSRVSFWVDPSRDAGGRPDAVAESPSDRCAEDLNALGFRIGKAMTHEDRVVFDEIVLAETWESALGGK
jgi:hypothetical protein